RGHREFDGTSTNRPPQATGCRVFSPVPTIFFRGRCPVFANGFWDLAADRRNLAVVAWTPDGCRAPFAAIPPRLSTNRIPLGCRRRLCFRRLPMVWGGSRITSCHLWSAKDFAHGETGVSP